MAERVSKSAVRQIVKRDVVLDSIALAMGNLLGWGQGWAGVASTRSACYKCSDIYSEGQ
jgi:hypothetical protein